MLAMTQYRRRGFGDDASDALTAVGGGCPPGTRVVQADDGTAACVISDDAPDSITDDGSGGQPAAFAAVQAAFTALRNGASNIAAQVAATTAAIAAGATPAAAGAASTAAVQAAVTGAAPATAVAAATIAAKQTVTPFYKQPKFWGIAGAGTAALLGIVWLLK